jgi:enoyl-CoA hydratase
MTQEPELLISRPLAGAVVLTLNRPQAMNALSRTLRTQLTSAFRTLAGEPSTRVIVVTGAGRAFCAGLDLKELGSLAGAADSVYDGDLIGAMNGFTGPIIGAINGAAITGGFELALACDLLIASTEARFADTHARVGVMPGWGLSQKLSRLIGPARAKELSLTGNFLSAQRAEAWGLVNRVVTPEALLPQSLALAQDMLSALPEMLVAYKRVIDAGYRTTLEHGLRIETEAAKAWANTLDPAAIEQRREAVRQRGHGQLERKDPT